LFSDGHIAEQDHGNDEAQGAEDYAPRHERLS
jgi:hypothetical protein